MKSAFKGFPPEGLEFLAQLAENNNRDWFQPRKAEYETLVRDPMLALVAAVNAQLEEFAPDYVSEPKKAVYRIYRDTRFSSDKTPYKDHVAAVFGRRGLQAKYAGLYMSVNHKQVEIAGGVYDPPPDILLAIRTHIAETHEEFRQVLAAKKLKTLMGPLRGEELTRVPKGFPSDHPAADLLRKKRFVLHVELDPGVATTPKLLAEVTSRFKVIQPVLEYLDRPVSAKKNRATSYPPSSHF